MKYWAIPGMHNNSATDPEISEQHLHGTEIEKEIKAGFRKMYHMEIKYFSNFRNWNIF